MKKIHWKKKTRGGSKNLKDLMKGPFRMKRKGYEVLLFPIIMNDKVVQGYIVINRLTKNKNNQWI